jgi:MoxR-like ATPase
MPSYQFTDEGELPPGMPRMVRIGDVLAPAAAWDLADMDVEGAVLADLAMKAAFLSSEVTTAAIAQRIALPLYLAGKLLERLRASHLVEVLGEAGPLGYRYAATQRGRERAGQLLEVSGYVGPAPVSLEAYSAMVEWQRAQADPVDPERVVAALAELVLSDDVKLLAGLAVATGRALFVFGPPGNGKTTLGRLLHNALPGEIWVPHCINVDSSIIRVFDVQCHQPAGPLAGPVDPRWVRIRRPFIIGGGELRIESFDLIYSPSLRYYEAPLHLKANGGILLIDDFGRQRVEPHELLNRWIIPLEYQVDYLNLRTGQKIEVPFRQSLIIATNLDPADVMDPAFLRRMGYRLQLCPPTPDQYAEIFRLCAERAGVEAPEDQIERLLDRYRLERRELRGCEPRDLIDRALELRRFRGRTPELTPDDLDLAWAGYFGTLTAEGTRPARDPSARPAHPETGRSAPRDPRLIALRRNVPS